MKKLSYLFIALMLISLVSGCGENVAESPDIAPSSVISPAIDASPEVSLPPVTDEGTENGEVVESPEVSPETSPAQ